MTCRAVRRCRCRCMVEGLGLSTCPQSDILHAPGDGHAAARRASAGTAQTVSHKFDDLRAVSHQGETVYVTDLAGATTKGRVLRISANSIALVVNNRTRDWPAPEVTSITQRRGSAGRGALIGLAVGAVLGPALVAFDSGGDDYVLFFAPFAAGLGGGIGAAIGRPGDRSVCCSAAAVVPPRFWWRPGWRRAPLSGARKSASECGRSGQRITRVMIR